MKKSILVFTLCLALLGQSCAWTNRVPGQLSPTASPASLPTPSAAPLPSEIAGATAPEKIPAVIERQTSRVVRDVVYCTMGGVSLKADVYLPRQARAKTPLLIFVHGGGWRSGSKDGGAGFADFPALLGAGFALASIDYRLVPDFTIPDMIQDVKCAVRSFRANANQFGIDPERIGVWGTSAGGHLVAMLGTTDSSAGFDVGEYLTYSSRVQAVVDLFGPTDLYAMTTPIQRREMGKNYFGTAALTPEEVARAMPLMYVSRDDPPFLIIHGDVDKTVPVEQSKMLYDKLTAAGVDARLVIVKGGEHGLATPGETPSRLEITRMITEFFKKNLL